MGDMHAAVGYTYSYTQQQRGECAIPDVAGRELSYILHTSCKSYFEVALCIIMVFACLFTFITLFLDHNVHIFRDDISYIFHVIFLSYFTHTHTHTHTFHK